LDFMEKDYIARDLGVNGIVQGVGFRPFVYQLANKHGLNGEIANTSSGVSIHLEGRKANIEAFCHDLAQKGPPLAHITEILIDDGHIEGRQSFSIVESRRQDYHSTLISPDVSICNDCLDELLDQSNRRFLYPFINCTNCGPRYTIIDDIPYDRPSTSMKHFRMCPHCQAEYDDPLNRRFHAQPNACAGCGPHVQLHERNGTTITVPNPIETAATLLKEGHILAIKGLGGFHLAADAENDESVARLRKRKNREEKPLAVMSYDLASIEQYAQVGPENEQLLTSYRRPIVLLEKKHPNSLSEHVSPRNRYFGVMLPYTPLHYLLLREGFAALVMTSGNLSEEPIVIENDIAFERLSGITDYFLVHNRGIYLRSDDSIVKRIAGATRLIRRSRGYVPRPVFLNKKVPEILACGAELKNTVCLTKENQAFLSQHIGDLENLETYSFLELTVRHMKKILDIDPEIVAYDMHPDYLSTRYAQEQEHLAKIPVQHHHAHIVSCMAEYGLEGPVIGLAFDGTGYGTDGAIWGGEVLLAEEGQFSRAAHISYVPMPGGASVIKEPWRMAVSYLYQTFGQDLWDLDLPLIKKEDSKKIAFICEMISKGVNCPQTSSLGRLFDGVAAILGVRDRVHYEGQAAMELEMLTDKAPRAYYPYEWKAKNPCLISPDPLIRGIVEDVRRGTSPPLISGKFHRTLISLFTDICVVLREESGLNRVVLSGGVFQNAILLSGLIESLNSIDFQVFAHEQVPTNDGGVSLGQALVAAATAGKRRS